MFGRRRRHEPPVNPLRTKVLELDPGAAGIPVLGDQAVYGAIMELGMGDAVATLVALTGGGAGL